MDGQKKYLEFASSLSFFEFTQEEFYNPNFDLTGYSDEIKVLEENKSISMEKLTELLSKNPKLFDIFEQIFQLYRFTNTQLINFLFDIDILNAMDEEKIIKYLIQNLTNDEKFKSTFDRYIKKNKLEYSNYEELQNIDNDLLIKLFKEAIVSHIKSSSKKREQIYSRIKNIENVTTRLAEYLFENLKLNDMLESINLTSYLKNKRIPRDTKTIHGKFGTIKLADIMVKAGIINADEKFKQLNIKKLDYDISDKNDLLEFKGKWIFVTEKYINDILKRKQKKPKKFDFIILYDLKIKYAIETNFYSTSGSKIGINEEEYIDLNDEVKEKIPNIEFLWITDGNYWLTSDGESRFTRDLDYFGDNILNYNQFKLKMEKVMK